MSGENIIARVVALDASGLNRDAIASTLGTSRRTVDLALSWKSKTEVKRTAGRRTVAELATPTPIAPRPRTAPPVPSGVSLNVGLPKLSGRRRVALAALAKRRVKADPTPEEIRVAAAAIRAGWSSKMRRQRRLLGPSRWSVPTFSESELQCVDYCEG